MPSSLRQICAIAPALRASSANPGTTACARSTKSRAASLRATSSVLGASFSGKDSDGTRYAISPSTPSASRLVATICSVGTVLKSDCAIRAASSMTCSQLSSSNKLRLPASVFSTTANGATFPSARARSAAATVWAIASRR